MSAGVTIKAFGYISSLLGTSEVTIPCDRQLPLSAILAQLKNNYPSLSQYLPQHNSLEEHLLILCNGKEQNLDSIIHPGEEVILVTPISGG